MKTTQRGAVLCVLSIAIACVSLLNVVVLEHKATATPRSRVSPAASKVHVNITRTIERTCNTPDGQIPRVNTSSAPQPGSTAASILPRHQYPTIHHSCFFIPTSPREHSQHSYLLQYYPNSFLVVTSETETDVVRLDTESRTIYIRGADEYALLWIKSMLLWDYISTQSNNPTFVHCNWFFKVDSDAFLNLHVIEQYLSQYSHNDDHYLGWYAGNGGRKRNDQTVNMAIGAFYGFSRALIRKWHGWNQDGKFTWGYIDDHKGEDSQVSFFLREHGVCLDVPVVDTLMFKNRGGMWEGFDRAHPLGVEYFRDSCTKKIHDMVKNECFTHAHKVWIEWMPVVLDVTRAHVEKRTKCELIGKGVSRVVNGTVYHRGGKKSQCTIAECDPCLKDASTNDCCGWEPAK